MVASVIKLAGTRACRGGPRTRVERVLTICGAYWELIINSPSCEISILSSSLAIVSGVEVALLRYASQKILA